MINHETGSEQWEQIQTAALVIVVLILASILAGAVVVVALTRWVIG